ncbi:spore germination lipoprotein GerD [Lentibacillus saliphilus]|uniref:spore germination lipoprotein GerD n=1 Tax=Lentibacillus saliphilus TaxID=2737028 RepID=UPI001C2FFF2E|nr:spore germination lipoprotein GerD [Lentibacillus saliphilus]
MLRMHPAILLVCLFVFLAACSNEGAGGKDADYETTKKMVVDILQTEDGKKALSDILSDEKMKEQLVINSDIVKKSINETLASDKGTDMWKKLFEDPKFVKKFSESMSEEQKQLMKDLMKDAEFQKQMLDILKDPKMTEQFIIVLKSQEFRAHLEETIQQTLETPTFQAKIQDILLKAAEKQTSGKSDGKESGGGSGEDTGGGEGGGG